MYNTKIFGNYNFTLKFQQKGKEKKNWEIRTTHCCVDKYFLYANFT